VADDREILHGRSEPELVQARAALATLFGTPANQATRRQRIAADRLRGAGKSTLGRLLAESWQVPVRRAEPQHRGGRRLQPRRDPFALRAGRLPALREARARGDDPALSEGRDRDAGRHRLRPATFSLLLAQCYTVWVRATPEEHMGRVLAQGDTRPMAGHAGNREAMNDLRRILESRAAFYAKADEVFETSGRTIEQSFASLQAQLEPVTRIGGAERIA
jgi:XRE family aerobic/anaerobic benzoate catabolism transcriptional regulator